MPPLILYRTFRINFSKPHHFYFLFQNIKGQSIFENLLIGEHLPTCMIASHMPRCEYRIFFFFVITFLQILTPFKLCLYIFVKAQCPFDIYLIINSATEIKLITVNCKGLGTPPPLKKRQAVVFFEKLKNYYSVKRKE